MSQEEKLNKEEEEEAVLRFMESVYKWRNIFNIIIFFSIYNLTRFYPFSDILHDHTGHYKYKPARDLDGKIWKKFKIEIGTIADDGTFLHMFYPPKSVDIKKLHKFVEKEGAYANLSVDDMIEVKVPKNSK